MNIRKAIGVFVVLAWPSIVSADSLKLVVVTDPAGATLYANDSGQLMGYAPFELKYELPRGFFKDGRCTTLQGLKVRWASGAEASINGLQACAQSGKRQQFVFVRPDVPGRAIDAEFALRLEELALARESARAERSRRIAEIWSQYAERQRAIAESYRPVTCTSNLIGSTVYTTCR